MLEGDHAVDAVEPRQLVAGHGHGFTGASVAVLRDELGDLGDVLGASVPGLRCHRRTPSMAMAATVVVESLGFTGFFASPGASPPLTKGANRLGSVTLLCSYQGSGQLADCRADLRSSRHLNETLGADGSSHRVERFAFYGLRHGLVSPWGQTHARAFYANAAR